MNNKLVSNTHIRCYITHRQIFDCDSFLVVQPPPLNVFWLWNVSNTSFWRILLDWTSKRSSENGGKFRFPPWNLLFWTLIFMSFTNRTQLKCCGTTRMMFLKLLKNSKIFPIFAFQVSTRFLLSNYFCCQTKAFVTFYRPSESYPGESRALAHWALHFFTHW